MRDVNYGWLLRYIHANVASFFFIFVYIHIGRGLYYGSYRAPRTLLWSIGVIILVLMMATAFLGYQNSLTWVFIETTYLQQSFSGVFFATLPRFKKLSDEMRAWVSERMRQLNSGEGNPFYGKTHSEETRELMREAFSDERREQVGNINRGTNLSDFTRAALRHAALQRPPMSDETRAKVSENHARVLTLGISLLDGSNPVTVRGILAAANHMNCGEKTVRVALKGNGIVKRTWQVRVLSRGKSQ